MAQYIIGDVHGQFRTLEKLLAHIHFNPSRDEVFLTGDLINGPQSLEVIYWARENARIVLGNHDLHLLAVLKDPKLYRKKKDDFAGVLTASDRKSVFKWLIKQPLMIREKEFALVHAGVYPRWGLKKALGIAEDASSFLNADPVHALSVMYGNLPQKWSKAENDEEQFRFAINAFTRMRVIEGKAKLDFDYKLTYGEIPEGRRAWFDLRKATRRRVYFGHWAALGLFLRTDVAGLDSGCRWGGPLTAIRVDDGAVFQQRREKAA